MARRSLSDDTKLIAQLATMSDDALKMVNDVSFSILARRRQQTTTPKAKTRKKRAAKEPAVLAPDLGK